MRKYTDIHEKPNTEPIFSFLPHLEEGKTIPEGGNGRKKIKI